jgi:hypothetical protein
MTSSSATGYSWSTSPAASGLPLPAAPSVSIVPPTTPGSARSTGRAQTNGADKSLHKTILDECWRPAFARYLQVRFQGLRRDLADYLRYYNFERAHTGRLTRGPIPADIVYGARKIDAR